MRRPSSAAGCRRCVLIALAATLATSAFAAEVGPVKIFKPDANHVLELNMTAAAKEVVIGGYQVRENNSLMVCGNNGTDCADPYAGAVLKLDPRDKLIINLKNQLANTGGNMTMDNCMVMSGSDNSLLNLHTHGLMVSPYARQPATGQAVFGDRIFECTSSQSRHGHIVGDAMRYEITLNDNGPGQSHPLGIDWIHPHVHGIAKAQVSSGMASMIVVGDINKQLCAMPAPDGAAPPAQCQDRIPPEAVKHLILKDAQIVKKTASPDSYSTYADQEPDFCGSNKLDSSNAGECAADPTTFSPGSDWDAKSGKWVFTVNGQKMPHWEIGPDKYEVWRVQNASANVTYHLSLQALGFGGGVAAKASFQVLDMDGAGLVAANSAEPMPLPKTTDILLMPGSRADLLVQSPAEAGSDVSYRLVNDNFQAGYAIGDADVWPHVALATITFRASRVHVAAMQPVTAMPAAAALESPVRIDESKIKAELPQECSGFDDATLTEADRQFYYDHLHAGPPWKRRVYFGISGDTFMLGDTLLDGGSGKEYDKFGREITGDRPVTLSDFAMPDGKTSMCVRKAEGDEIWQLVNVTNEVHNFHIHQMKFSVVRQEGGSHAGDPVMRVQSPIDAVGLPSQLLFKEGKADLKHDTIIVPRGKTDCGDSLTKIDDHHFALKRGDQANACVGTGSADDISGMIEVRLNFNGSQLSAYDDGKGHLQNAKFVYHCHILEHEDKGMMAGITVIDPNIYH